ncbi:hypothetical protein DDE83_003686 [Stemphylium lycopersici]|uniref:Uncharacterized protein n=1 Tax=Stemphylium lycopersici TaxID=183478 RepID=A0A364N6Y3_STELY|nr:hypothetical protein DDE83_003686 [Stemphylium lycopersici]
MLHAQRTNLTNETKPASLLAAQWSNPSDTLSVLLLLGADVVQRAVAEQSGRSITPVAFSFGWVAYATGALLSAFGDGRLMPDSDINNTLVISAVTGHQRTSKNWVLGRLLRDFDDDNDAEMENEEAHASTGTTDPDTDKVKRASEPPAVAWEALRVSVYEFDKQPPCLHGVPAVDWVWLSGFGIILVQLVIAIIPWISGGSWAAFLTTASGNILALIGGSLPQWKAEKWACPKNGGATVAITQGNGSRHVVVIKGERGYGLDLEVHANIEVFPTDKTCSALGYLAVSKTSWRREFIGTLAL